MQSDEARHQLIMGSMGASGDFAATRPRRNMLVLGPPRSDKTVGVLIPSILGHPGRSSPLRPRMTFSGPRQLFGLAWGASGITTPMVGETLPGCIPLRWSPIRPSKDWSMAVMLGKSMADVAEMGGSSGDGEYFRAKAGVLIAALLHAAALGDKPMMWMLKAVSNDRRTLDEASEILADSIVPEDQIAATDLQGIRDLEARSQGAIFATTANAFAAYRLPGALASTVNPNFDPASFVAGDPQGFNPRRWAMMRPEEERPGLENIRWENSRGIYDTIYLTASSTRQALVAPIVAGLLGQLQEASFIQHRSDERR